MSDTLRERCEKLAQKWEGYAKAEAFVPHGFEAQSRKTFGAAASELREALAVPEPAASERYTSIECLAAEFAQLRAERDREIDTLREQVIDKYRALDSIVILLGPGVCDEHPPILDAENVVRAVDKHVKACNGLNQIIEAQRLKLAEKDREADEWLELAISAGIEWAASDTASNPKPTVASVRAAKGQSK